jgi:dephospho-CoA kinase
MSKLILGFTGLIASGKDISKKYLQDKYQAQGFRFSTVLRDVLTRLGLEVNRDNLIDISVCLRQTFGEDLLAKTVAKDVKEATSDLIVVEGIRRLADIEHLRQIPNFHLIRIEADPKIRYARCVARNENVGDDIKTFEEFLADHQKETEISAVEVMAQAELAINNDGGPAQLYQQLDKIMTDLT